jgi:hypothetical protein
MRMGSFIIGSLAGAAAVMILNRNSRGINNKMYNSSMSNGTASSQNLKSTWIERILGMFLPNQTNHSYSSQNGQPTNQNNYKNSTNQFEVQPAASSNESMTTS